MKCMDQLPSVTTCCFCCFLRAGNVMIAMVSFTVGLILAPNVSQAQYPWNPGPEQQGTVTEVSLQIGLGVVSILLCICSFLLFVGSICSVPILIEMYQWGAVVYGSTTSVMYIILAFFCFFVHTNSIAAGCWLIALVFLNIFLTIYFIVVANSLRMSLLFLYSTDVLY